MLARFGVRVDFSREGREDMQWRVGMPVARSARAFPAPLAVVVGVETSQLLADPLANQHPLFVSRALEFSLLLIVKSIGIGMLADVRLHLSNARLLLSSTLTSVSASTISSSANEWAVPHRDARLEPVASL